MPPALFYTKNVKEKALVELGYDKFIGRMQRVLARTFGSYEVLLATDTYQFSDYGKYLSTVWDQAAKANRKEEVFPQVCAKAFAIGEMLALASSKE